MSNKILLVDDEANMRLGLSDNLEFEGYDVDTAEHGKEGLEKILNNTYDLVLLDVMMPEMSGYDVCKEARAKGIDIPIILLTAKGEEIDKVLGLELGADDYITKPFGVRELMARIKANLRRAPAGGKKDETPEGDIAIGNLTVNFHSYSAIDQSDITVRMSHKEIEILHYLYKRKNEVVSRYDLLENVWGYEEAPTTRTVDNFIVKLRNKIEFDASDPKTIITVHGVGYTLID